MDKSRDSFYLLCVMSNQICIEKLTLARFILSEYFFYLGEILIFWLTYAERFNEN